MEGLTAEEVLGILLPKIKKISGGLTNLVYVDELPETGDIHTLYVVPKKEGKETYNNCNVFLWTTNNGWEQLDIDVDLSDYVKNTLLYSDGLEIYSDKEMTKVMTFTEIKALLNDKSKNVVLYNGNYVLRPEYTYSKEGEEAIWFNGVTSLSEVPYIYRITINSNNQVINSEYRLVTYAELTALVNRVSALEPEEGYNTYTVKA